MFLPEEDRYSYTKQRLESQIASLFGGRIAEYLIFGEKQITTGASNDIQRATEIARNMITKWGLSERLGPLTYNQENEEVFLGHQITKSNKFSDDTAQLIDEESRSIINRNYKLAETLLKDNIEKLHLMAEALIKYETIDSSQINDIMEGKPPREPKGWSNESKKDTPSSSEEKSPSQKDSTITDDPAVDSL